MQITPAMTARAIITDIKKLSSRERTKVFVWVDHHLAYLRDDSLISQKHKDIVNTHERNITEGKAKFLDWETAKRQISKITPAKKKSRRDGRK